METRQDSWFSMIDKAMLQLPRNNKLLTSLPLDSAIHNVTSLSLKLQYGSIYMCEDPDRL